jgi:hypothetical protein
MTIEYPHDIVKVVAAAYLLGATHFGENQPQENVLGQMFCYAVRNVLQEETRDLSGILQLFSRRV